MTGWLALLEGPQPVAAGLHGTPATTALVVEVALPLDEPAVLFDWHGEGPSGAAALSVFAAPQDGIAVLVRAGLRTARHRLVPPVPLPALGTLRLTLACVPDADWRMILEVPGSGWRRQTRGRGALALPLAALGAPAAVSGAAPGLLRHPAVLWAGIADGDAAPADLPWIGPATPVDTPRGPRPAAGLAAGDEVLTLAGPRRLASAGRHLTPLSGSAAPVRLRAPWFAAGCDLIVGPLQPVAMSGVAVDYLFGEERVLVRAGDLAGVPAARSEPRPGAAAGVVLRVAGDDEPGAGLVLAAGCALAVTDGSGAAARRLEAWEAVPLRQHLGPGLRARVA